MDTWTLLGRLALAALFGALIGVEREFRAKEAGLRTHYLVALGSCLFMVVSLYGFDLRSVLASQPEIAAQSVRVDVARVAAQIVTGVGFLGAGMIVLHKRFVVGLTTAAAIWTTAAIGAAAGGGLWVVAAAATALTLAGLELFRLVDRKIGTAKHELDVAFWAADNGAVGRALAALNAIRGVAVAGYEASRHGDTGVHVSLQIVSSARGARPGTVVEALRSIPGVEPERVE